MTDFIRLKSGVVVPVDFAEGAARPELDEIASIGNGRDITRGYVDALTILQPED